MSTQTLTDDSWQTLGKSLAVEPAALKAVAAVEAAGSGFLKDHPTKPKILFEGHAFHRLTGGRFAADRPDLSYPKWDKTKYGFISKNSAPWVKNSARVARPPSTV